MGSALRQTVGSTPGSAACRDRSFLIDEAAQLLGVSRRTIYYRIREGRLRTVRARGGSQRVLLSSIEELLRATRKTSALHWAVSASTEAGLAELLHAPSGGAPETTTFELTPAGDVNLQAHIGLQVEVSATVRTAQQIVSSAGAEEKSAKGTAGTPVVETKTELYVKRLEVNSLRHLGDRCEE